MKTILKSKNTDKVEKEENNSVVAPFFNWCIMIFTILVRQVVVVLNPTPRIGDRIVDSKNIFDMMSSSVFFPNPDPTMADFRILITVYSDAAAAVKAGSASAEAKLLEAWDALNAARKRLRNYVQNVCLINPAAAGEIAESAGMSIKNVSKHNKQDFEVKALAEGGADLSSKVKDRRCSSEWQCTENPDDPMGWYKKLIPSTLQAKTRVLGFTKHSTVYFRHRFILKDGPTEWSDILSLFII